MNSINNTPRKLLSTLKSNFRSKINIRKHIDLKDFLKTLREKDKDFLRKELNSYLRKYHSFEMLKNISILIHSAILIKSFNAYISNTQELQGFIESFQFVEEYSYDTLKNQLISMTITKLKEVIERATITKFVLVLDSALRQLQHIESIKQENFQTIVANTLYEHFIYNNLRQLSSEFIVFNKRFQTQSENVLRRLSTQDIIKFPYLSKLKISDNLKNKLKPYFNDSNMLPEPNPIETDFKLKKFVIPKFTIIQNLNDYQIHAPMPGVNEKKKSKKYFFKVIINEELGLVLKSIQFKTIDSSEFNIFNFINSNYNLSLPKIRGFTYTNENIIQSSYRGLDVSENLNVLKIFFENFDILEDQSISANFFISELNKIITTLEFLNRNNLRVPILFINSFGVNSEKIFFIDFQNVQTSNEEKFSFGWLEDNYKEYSSWLEYIGVDGKNEFYWLETLQCWCLAAIFRIKIKMRSDDGDRILNVLSREAVKLSDVRNCINEEHTLSLLTSSMQSCSLKSN